MERYLVSSLGLIFTGSIGAFFLYVPMWPVIGVAVVVMALILMFALGLYVGRGIRTGQQRQPSRESISLPEHAKNRSLTLVAR